jgi:hypothetical protein
MYFFQRWITNCGIICNYTRIRLFQLGSFDLFLPKYRGLWSKTEIGFFFPNKWLINKMITSSVSEGAKIEHINLRKLQKLHTPISNTSFKPSEWKPPKYPDAKISKFTIYHAWTYLRYFSKLLRYWQVWTSKLYIKINIPSFVFRRYSTDFG